MIQGFSPSFPITVLFFSLIVIPSPGYSLDVSNPPDQFALEVNGDFNEEFDADFEADFGDDFAGESAFAIIPDPLEPINRGFFWVNNQLYFIILKPAITVFRVVPEPGRLGIRNFFSNLLTPIRFGSSLLQFKLKDAGTELGRFTVNSTVGILGLFDPARTQLGWQRKDEDFGQVLGFYGLGPGFYLFFPILGPSSVRDSIGLVGDAYMNPLYYRYINLNEDYRLNWWQRTAVLGLNQLNSFAMEPDTYETILKESLDPYITIRNAYHQNREGRIKQ